MLCLLHKGDGSAEGFDRCEWIPDEDERHLPYPSSPSEPSMSGSDTEVDYDENDDIAEE